MITGFTQLAEIWLCSIQNTISLKQSHHLKLNEHPPQSGKNNWPLDKSVDHQLSLQKWADEGAGNRTAAPSFPSGTEMKLVERANSDQSKKSRSESSGDISHAERNKQQDVCERLVKQLPGQTGSANVADEWIRAQSNKCGEISKRMIHSAKTMRATGSCWLAVASAKNQLRIWEHEKHGKIMELKGLSRGLAWWESHIFIGV